MTTLKRNKRPFYYCLFASAITVLDEYGNESGEQILTYADAVLSHGNISQATGQSNAEQFGTLENYDKVIVTEDLNCPINENSVLFIDKAPEYKTVPIYTATAVTTTASSVSVPVPDYIVRRVAKSLNSVSIAIRKVTVS